MRFNRPTEGIMQFNNPTDRRIDQSYGMPRHSPMPSPDRRRFNPDRFEPDRRRYEPDRMPMPSPERFPGYNTSETARENFISRTDGGYPNRQDPSFMDRYGDYINRGLDYMPSPIGVGSRILKGLPSLSIQDIIREGLDYPSFVRDTDSFGDYPAEKMRDPDDDEASGIMGALPQERQTAGLYQQWKKIADKLGEAYANDWLASQQAV